MTGLFDADLAAARIANGRFAKLSPLKRFARSWLARPFPRDGRKRVLLVSVDHELAWQQFHPYFHFHRRFQAMNVVFRVVDYDRFRREGLKHDADALFIQFPHLQPAPEQSEMLESLRRTRPQAPIVFFDWFAPTDLRFAEIAAPWVTAYVKKALLRDRELYLQPLRGHTYLEDQFAARLDIPDIPAPWSFDSAILDRVVLGPSFWAAPKQIGGFAAPHARPAGGPRPIDVQARIATRGTPWYAAMRQEAKAAADHLAASFAVAANGALDYPAYMAELGRSRLCFSPFGYGEICWRDWEAILMGAVLVKPDMSHIEAEPDIYRAGETYIPVRWDLADLEDQVRQALADPARCQRIAAAAFEEVHRYLAGPAMEKNLEHLLNPAA